MTVDIEVNSVAAAVAVPNLSVVENQAENSPSIMPTIEPQTTNLATVERELSARRSKDKGKQADNSTPPYHSFAAVFRGTNDNEAGPSRTSVMEQLETPAVIQRTQNATNAITAAGHENFANVNGEGNMARVWNGLKALMTEEITLPRLWYKNKYYVFLSIRSEPPDCGVGDAFFRLYLCDRKINTYKDDDYKQWKDETVPQELRRALKQSKIIIIFFSEFYADSPSCLELLAYIIDQFPERYFNIIPVFNGVDRADLELKTQTGKYAKAFRTHYRHYPREIVDKWMESLRKVAILPSWKMKHGDRTEFKVLAAILNAVSKKVDRMVIDDSGFAAFYNDITRLTTTISAAFSYILPPYQRLERDRNHDLAPMRVPLRNGDYMVGLDARLKEVLSCLRFEPDRVLFVGIYGKAGIGKITIARETFNMIAEHFDDDSCCFVPNVGNNSRKYGLVALQDKLLSELTTGVTYKKINNVIQGCLAIYNKLHTRKVLILLHDVDAAEQLKVLAGRANCFGPGSLIIITTEKEELLDKVELGNTGDLSKYSVSSLNHSDALGLLCHYAFEQKVTVEEKDGIIKRYKDLFEEFLECAEGNPMILKQIGIKMLGKSLTLWRLLLDEIKRTEGGASKWVIKAAADSSPQIVIDINSPATVGSRQGFCTNFFQRLQGFYKYNPNWKTVGFLSSLVWATCFGLSPSLGRLIGGWNVWKDALYGILVTFVWCNMLFATQATLRIWYVKYQNVGFVALIFIALYSHYFDEAVKGNPAILDVVSDIALACMSLGLSKRMMYDREFALFTFSVHNLLVQSWIINKWLFVFVLILGYILFQKNSPAPQRPHVD